MPFTQDTPIEDYYPYFLSFNMAHVCNFRCTYCSYHSKILSSDKRRIKANKYILPADHFYRQVNILKEAYDEVGKPFQINLSGLGEPFMNRELISMVQFLNDSGIPFGVVTNYSKLATPHIESLVDLGVKVIHTNMDGGDKETYEKTRPGANYDISISNIRNTMEYIEKTNANSRLHIHFIVTPWNYRELIPFFDLMHELGVKNTYVKMVVEMEYDTSDIFFKSFEQQSELFDAIREAKQYAQSLGIQMGTAPYVEIYAGINTKPLRVMLENTTLCYTPIDGMWFNFGPLHYTDEQLLGNVNVVCPLRVQDDFHSLGNLYKDDFRDIINRRARLDILKDMQEKKIRECCKSCEYHYLKVYETLEEKVAQCDSMMAQAASAVDQNDLPAAEEGFSKVLEIDACHTEAHAGLARLYIQSNRPEQALSHAREARRFSPDNDEYEKLVNMAQHILEG